MPAPVELFLASSNPGKLAEYRVLASDFSPNRPLGLSLLPDFDALPVFAEQAPTFAENAAGKALHYSAFQVGLVFADDSGLVVPALNGAPGVQSARYAGPRGSDQDRIAKLLREMRGLSGTDRRAHFVCTIALFDRARPVAIVSGRADGTILETPRGAGGFGYDPIFYFRPLQKSFSELEAAEKNRYSHRGKAFRRLLTLLPAVV